MNTRSSGKLRNNKKYTIIIASGPVIIEKGKVLLVRQGKDKFWKFPGGTDAKAGDSLEKMAERNVKREIDIKIKIIRPLKPMIIWHKNEIIILIHYLAKRIGVVKPGKHVHEWKWIDTNKLPKDIAPNIMPVIKEISL